MKKFYESPIPVPRRKKPKITPHIHKLEYHHYDAMRACDVYFCKCGLRDTISNLTKML